MVIYGIDFRIVQESKLLPATVNCILNFLNFIFASHSDHISLFQFCLFPVSYITNSIFTHLSNLFLSLSLLAIRRMMLIEK